MAEEPDEPVLAREDEDDYDLLTYGEAGARVSQEIAAERNRLADWEARLAAGEDVADSRDRSAHRLELLRDAAKRNARQPITDENFERFFGYSGHAKRNT
ncbi:MAG: hypothetical protein QOE84_947 [Actinomycetota bacterium]|nr:hypothetical protein [Actinomycetota bacterium]